MTDTNAQPTDGLEFVHSGIIRFHFGSDKVVRVRRPFLGELKTLRLALEEVEDELAPVRTEGMLDGQQHLEQRQAVAKDLDDGTIDAAQFSKLLAEIRDSERGVGARIEGERERLYLGWWSDVFDLLAMDPLPDDYPAWIMDPTLPVRVLTHWRTVPAGPG